MIKKRVFVSFDFDNDNDIKGSLVAQGKMNNSSFKIVDMSVNEKIDENWRQEVRERIRQCDCVIFLCGRQTELAKGVTAEMSLTREEKIPYFLLRGRKKGKVTKPTGALKEDQVYRWSAKNLESLLEGIR